MAGADPRTSSDAATSLLAAAQTGASWALGELWRELSPAVHAFLRARGAEEAEDLTSEVFLAAFEQLPGFTGGADQFRSFVFTIAYRRLVDDLRRRSRRGPTFEWTDEGDLRSSPSAEQEALSRIGDERTRRLLEELPEAQRDVLVLRILGDLTIDEIAAIVGKRPGAVKALQRRGLEALRKKVPAPRTPGRPFSDSEK